MPTILRSFRLLAVAVPLLLQTPFAAPVAAQLPLPTTVPGEAVGASGETAEPDTVETAQDFLRYYEAHVRPLEVEANLAWWDANLSGSDEDYAKKQEKENLINQTLASEFRFEQIKKLRSESVEDPLLARQIDLLYLKYLPKQVDPKLMQKITSKANEIEQKFNIFRAEVDGERLTDNQVRAILRDSDDVLLREKAWKASKVIGAELEASLRELVDLRNEAARNLDYDNFHLMQIALQEQDPEELLALFDELDELTREPYRLAKQEIDARLAARYQIPVAALRPWHYHDPFLQVPPDISDFDTDAVFKDTDVAKVCERFYRGIGLPVQEVLAASDLSEKPNKNPHAFCVDINREGDVRVLANLKPNSYGMTTMLHELGHAVYSSRFIPETLPYMLRTEAHALTTEGVAMMFERLAGHSAWLSEMEIEVQDPQAYDAACRRARRDRLLFFSRWCQVMFRFERALYETPERDLNALWWELVERYQLLPRPEGRDAPDYASKIHLVSYPAYYHNYLLGELFACQLHAAIAREVLKAPDPTTAVYSENRDVGRFLRDRLFDLGASRPWGEAIQVATGEKLSPEAFARELATSP